MSYPWRVRDLTEHDDGSVTLRWTRPGCIEPKFTHATAEQLEHLRRNHPEVLPRPKEAA